MQIKDFITATALALTDLLPLGQSSNTRKTTLQDLKNLLLGTSTLTTTDKTVNGAINENKANIGDLTALTTTDKSSLVNAVKENTASLSELAKQNLLINGDFQIWQRGTSFTGVDGGKYTADRWRANNSVPSALKIDKVDSGLKMTWLSQALGTISYYMEEKNSLLGKTISLSIKIDGGVYKYTGVISSLLQHIKFDLSTKIFSISNDSVSSLCMFEIMHPNAIANTSYTINYAKLEMGSIVTPFVSRLYVEELALCQRYYEKSYADADLPGSINRNGSIFIGQFPSGTLTRVPFNFKTRKRIPPTINIYSTQTGVVGNVTQWSSAGATADVSCTASDASQSGCARVETLLGASSVFVSFHWTADAEI